MHHNATCSWNRSTVAAIAAGVVVMLHVMAGGGFAQQSLQRVDPLVRLNERLDALERENARLQGLLLQ